MRIFFLSPPQTYGFKQQEVRKNQAISRTYDPQADKVQKSFYQAFHPPIRIAYNPDTDDNINTYFDPSLVPLGADQSTMEQSEPLSKKDRNIMARMTAQLEARFSDYEKFEAKCKSDSNEILEHIKNDIRNNMGRLSEDDKMAAVAAFSEDHIRWSTFERFPFLNKYKIYISKLAINRLELIKHIIALNKNHTILKEAAFTRDLYLFCTSTTADLPGRLVDEYIEATINSGAVGGKKGMLKFLKNAQVQLVTDASSPDGLEKLADLITRCNSSIEENASSFQEYTSSPIKVAEYRNSTQAILTHQLGFALLNYIEGFQTHSACLPLKEAAKASNWAKLEEGLKGTCNFPMLMRAAVLEAADSYESILKSYLEMTALSPSPPLQIVFLQSLETQEEPESMDPLLTTQKPARTAIQPTAVSAKQIIEKSKSPLEPGTRIRIDDRVRRMLDPNLTIEKMRKFPSLSKHSGERLIEYARRHTLPKILSLLNVPEFVEFFTLTSNSHRGKHFSIYAVGILNGVGTPLKISATIDENRVCYHLYADPIRHNQKNAFVTQEMSETIGSKPISAEFEDFEPVSNASLSSPHNNIIRIDLEGYPMGFDSILLISNRRTPSQNLDGGGGGGGGGAASD